MSGPCSRWCPFALGAAMLFTLWDFDSGLKCRHELRVLSIGFLFPIRFCSRALNIRSRLLRWVVIRSPSHWIQAGIKPRTFHLELPALPSELLCFGNSHPILPLKDWYFYFLAYSYTEFSRQLIMSKGSTDLKRLVNTGMAQVLNIRVHFVTVRIFFHKIEKQDLVIVTRRRFGKKSVLKRWI